MKIKRFNEASIEWEDWEDLKASEKLTEMFFEESGNFGSEDEIEDEGLTKISFYFPVIDTDDLAQILKCKEYVQDFYAFYLNSVENPWSQNGTHEGDVALHIILTSDQKQKLDDKLELERSTNKYNL